MARRHWVLVSVIILGTAGFGAYALRDRWLGRVETMLGWAPAEATAAQPAGRPAGGRRRPGRQSGQSEPVPVLVADAKASDVPVFIDGVGSVRPLSTVTIRPQVSGKLAELHFDEGQDVRKGDVLVRIDDAVYRAQLDQAIGKKAQDQALLQNAELALDRSLKLVQSSSGTQQQVDTARSQVEQYRAAVQSDDAAIASAQASLDYTTIRAPIDGRTGIRNVDVGNIVSSSDAAGIVTLSQIRPISVVFSIPQQQLAKVNAASGGGQLSVEAIAGDGKSVIDNGVLAAVDNQVDATTGTVRIKANFPNDKLALWPGAFVNARLLVETLKGVIVVPTAAVQRGPNGTFVYLLKPDQTVGMKMVKLGQQDDVQTVIAEGVADGDKVVTTGFSRLRDGEHVEVAASQPPAATPGNPPGNPNEERRPNRRPQKTGGPEAASAAPVALPEAKQ
ncbi:Multidrug RND efflux transporter, membrane fusion protein MdtA [Neorhizobium galegae bv. officinalis bv. officinalis str. HAMBI 1141]|uniref:Multidrug RND efflux transporter, membrane fusion protein MdtA n=1 Tax=Neorhizobium galegae bv. officinalis bv. officinalis str. HAMBI 1141 TaxID=1028801 RepID=A0A068TBC4_NEOGA|nr:efflux RND transporter periplasmic adaptor subunit [Neorhizobium galegae]CDN55753.1 Multidrug RND efflux transporter, membrane fusion protein MdtA [Neorhizobium galegae bv. officinalis bv. officinalis str. HAMBI 1141]